ncbi:ABC transporter permease [Microbacterium forte]
MKLLDLIGSAISNTFRSKLRTSLTVVAIFIGAFTITITSAIGTGVSDYIDTQISTIGSSDTLTVTKSAAPAGDGLVEYDPDSSSQTTSMGPQTTSSLSDTDIASIEGIDGIESVETSVAISAKWVEHADSGKFVLSVSADTGPSGGDLDLAAGAQLDDSTAELEVVLPTNALEDLGWESAEDAIGETLTIAVDDYIGTEHTVDATVVGVQNESLLGGGAVADSALSRELQSAQSTGRPDTVAASYASATAVVTDADDLDAVKARLTDAGFSGQTTADQLGSFQAVINGIVGVLNAFAVIALIAAGFGIVNTLLMSVQERTREIGLMKAMGMGGGRVFTLFSLEAVFIGFLGSAIGAMAAIGVGSAISGVLSQTLLSDLPGLTLMQFAPSSVATIIVVVMAIAFLAGTLPARRAARQDPIEALRYE